MLNILDWVWVASFALSITVATNVHAQQGEAGLFELTDQGGDVTDAENAVGNEDGLRAILKKGAFITLVPEPESVLVSTGTAQPDLYVRARGTGSYRVELSMDGRKFTALSGTDYKGMSSIDLDQGDAPRRAAYIRITALSEGVEIDAVHAVRLSFSNSRGSVTVELPDKRSFDSMHYSWLVRDPEQALGAHDRVAALIEPGGILELQFQDRAFFSSDNSIGPDFDVHVLGLDGTYEVWVSENHDRFIKVGDVRNGTSGVDLDGAGLNRARFLRIVNTSRLASVQIDAVTTLSTVKQVVHREPNPLGASARWFRQVVHYKDATDISQLLGAENGAYATVAPGGSVTVMLDDLMDVASNGSIDGDILIKTGDSEAVFTIALSDTDILYRELELELEGTAFIDLDNYRIGRTRFIRIMNTSDFPLYIDSILALNTTPHQFHW